MMQFKNLLQGIYDSLSFIKKRGMLGAVHVDRKDFESSAELLEDGSILFYAAFPGSELPMTSRAFSNLDQFAEEYWLDASDWSFKNDDF